MPSIELSDNQLDFLIRVLNQHDVDLDWRTKAIADEIKPHVGATPEQKHEQAKINAARGYLGDLLTLLKSRSERVYIQVGRRFTTRDGATVFVGYASREMPGWYMVENEATRDKYLVNEQGFANINQREDERDIVSEVFQ